MNLKSVYVQNECIYSRFLCPPTLSQNNLTEDRGQKKQFLLSQKKWQDDFLKACI